MAREFPSRSSLYERFRDVSALLDNLFRVQALREEGDKVFLSFTLHTREDHGLIYDRAWQHSAALAESLSARWPAIAEAVSACRRAGPDLAKYAFIVVGCFSLDWGSLRELARLGYMSTGKDQTGGRFTVNAQEKVDLDLKGIYWGGHTDVSEGVALLSFGDHACVRKTLPDAIWRYPFRVSPQFDSPETKRLLSSYMDVLKRDAARLLRAQVRKDAAVGPEVACSTEALAAWLQHLGYLQNGDVAVPYFLAEDAPAAHSVRNLVFREVADWCAKHYERLKSDLSQITALRHGVDYSEVFIDLWHWVFGLTNKRLAEKGLIFDPYSPGHETPGCVGAVAEDPVLKG